MKLHYWRTSPHACKVLAVAKYLDLYDKITHNPAHPWEKDTCLTDLNPLSKVPVLELDEGMALFDSDVICAYLADIATGDKGLYPTTKPERFEALRLQALAGGMMESAVLLVLEEHVRPKQIQSLDWMTRQRLKMERCVLFLENNVASLNATTPTIGDMSLVMALAYFNFRFPSYVWHPEHPKLTAWFEQMLRLSAVAENLPLELHTMPSVMEKLQH